MPADLLIFLITVAALFFVGLPTITRRISLPAVIDFEVLNDNKSFIWAFVLCYLPLRLLGPTGLAPLWLSLWTSFIAGAVTSIQNRRKALL